MSEAMRRYEVDGEELEPWPEDFVYGKSGRYAVYLASDHERAMAEKEAELNLIDEALARRPALADCPTRYDKIMRACTMAARAEKTEADLSALKARYEKMRITPFDDHTRIAETFNKMGWSSPNDAQWDHLNEWCKMMRDQWLSSLPVEGLKERVAKELFIIANEWEGEDVTHGDWVLMVESAKQGYRKAASRLIRVIGGTR